MNIEIITKVLIPMLGAIIVYVIVPFFKSKTTKEQRDNIYFYVQLAVNAAEQIYKEKGQGKIKKEYVLEYMRQLNFDIDEADLEVMIEAAVIELNKSIEELK